MSDKKPYDKRLIFRLPSTLFEAAKAKAGITPLSAIVRRLIEKWVKGEIDLN